MAMTLRAPWASSDRVRPPGPGPISMVVPVPSSPPARAIRPVRLRSRRKCWPSARLAARPYRAMTSRRGGRVGAVPVGGGSLIGAGLRQAGSRPSRPAPNAMAPTRSLPDVDEGLRAQIAQIGTGQRVDSLSGQPAGDRILVDRRLHGRALVEQRQDGVTARGLDRTGDLALGHRR